MNSRNRYNVKVSKRVLGFTLMEVLIVVGIFAIISSISFTALSQYINVSEKLEENYRNIQSLQKAFIVMERDMRYMVDRSSRNTFGDREESVVIDNLNGEPGEKIRFSTSLRSNQTLGKMRRVAWAINQDQLWRISWSALDIEDDSKQYSGLIMKNVDSMDIEQYNWSDNFGLQIANQFDENTKLPFAIKITINLKDGSSFHRIFDLANGA